MTVRKPLVLDTGKLSELPAGDTLGASITGSAASAATVPWSGVTGTPTTLGGYGITDGGGSSSSSVYVSDTPPPTPVDGQQWYDGTSGIQYTWIDDGTGGGQWVEIGGAGGGVIVSDSEPSSPTNGQQWYDGTSGVQYTYVDDGDEGGQWVEIGGVNGNDGQDMVAKSVTTTVTDDTTTLLTRDGITGSGLILELDNHTLVMFSALVVAKRLNSQGSSRAFVKIEGAVTRGANAAATSMLSYTVTTFENTPGWGIIPVADTTTGGYTFSFTGTAANSVKVTATVTESEVTY